MDHHEKHEEPNINNSISNTNIANNSKSKINTIPNTINILNKKNSNKSNGFVNINNANENIRNYTKTKEIFGNKIMNGNVKVADNEIY